MDIGESLTYLGFFGNKKAKIQKFEKKKPSVGDNDYHHSNLYQKLVELMSATNSISI